MNLAAAFFSRRWFIATILVITGAAVCIRLGIWQLDRLEKRRAFNSRVEEQLQASILNLNETTPGKPITEMEYRKVEAIGRYDFDNQIALKNQYYGNEWGAHLVTPLVLDGSEEVVLVDRGWIPAADFESGNWRKFDESGRIEVSGVIRSAQSKAELGSRKDTVPAQGEPALKAWFFVDIEQISHQMPYLLMPVYIQQAPTNSWNGPPYRTQPKLELTEGPHMGYALQWFTFAALLLTGYPFYIRRQQDVEGSSKSKPQVHAASTGVNTGLP